MANKGQDVPQKTWKDKLDNAEPLNHLEEVKADADFNYRERLREEKNKKEFEAFKNRAGRAKRPSDDTADDESDQEGGK